MDLLDLFNTFIREEDLFSAGDRLLVAVSGGVDSVVLCALCHRAGFAFSMAHMNFQLRGQESDRDEEFVRQLGARYGKEVYLRKVQASSFAEEKGISVQVAARELRYAWFRELLEHVLPEVPGTKKFIATAHHLDDNVETLLMNFFRGTGIGGLRGMLPKQGEIVRPLLFARKKDLEEFARTHSLEWVNDSSNEKDYYTRNFFRHQVIPLVEKFYPQSMTNLAENLNRFREIELIYRQAVERTKKKLVERKGAEIHIPVLKLKNTDPLPTILFEVLKEFGFSFPQVREVMELLNSESGKYVSSSTHRVIRNRGWLIITGLDPSTGSTRIIQAEDEEIQGIPWRIRLSREPSQGPDKYKKTGPEWACLDEDLISFPLLLRPYRQGDYFYPLGMRKKKKIARFLIDRKMTRTEKERVMVLEMDKKIVWVAGLRIDDRFKVKESTRSVLKIEIEPGMT